MARKFYLSAIILLMQSISSFASAPAYEINVKEFGALGDGKNDDTAAIQNAMDAAGKALKGGRWEGKGIFYVTGPEVIFPPGKYKITDTLYPSSRILKGMGEACIEQHTPEKDIFFFKSSWQCKIEGLVLLGGNTQISLGNPNMDKGQIIIESCKFYHSKGPALITRKGTNSTFFNIRECIFIKCHQAVISNCDWTTIRDCWITSDESMENMAVIENNHGVMTIDNMLGVPLCKGIEQRWIDNISGSIICTNCRFGGEGGGFTPVYNFAKFRSSGVGNFVIIENSWLCSLSNYKGMCAVYCEEIPNCIEIRSSILCGIMPVKISKKVNQKNYFAGANTGLLKFSVTSVGELNELPEMLKNPVIIPKNINGQINPDETRIKLNSIIENLSKNELPVKSDSKESEYIQPPKENWSISECMDGSSRKNSEYLALSFAGDKAVIMQRFDDDENCPHVEIKNINMDVDTYPILSLQISPDKNQGPFQTALKIIDNDDENLYALAGRNRKLKQSYDLKSLGLSGKKNLTLRIYYIGNEYIPATAEKAFTLKHSKPGDYIVIDHVRFQKEKN